MVLNFYAEYETSPNDTAAIVNDMNVELHCQTSSNLDFSMWEIFLDNGTYWTVSASDSEQQLSRLVLQLMKRCYHDNDIIIVILYRGFVFELATRALRIVKVQDFHAGTYRCKATKIIGGSCIYYSDNATLTVKGMKKNIPQISTHGMHAVNAN